MPRAKNSTPKLKPSAILAANIAGQDPAKVPSKAANPKAAAATAHQPKPVDPLQTQPTPDGNAQIIAALLMAGKTLAEAQAMINNETPQSVQQEMADAAKHAKRVVTKAEMDGDEDVDISKIEDPGDLSPIVDVDISARPGFNMLETVYQIKKEMEGSRDYKRYRLPALTIDGGLFQWLIYAVIQEAQFRRNVNFGFESYLVQKLKEAKATDPSQGGQRNPISSGPREAFDGKTGGWNA